MASNLSKSAQQYVSTWGISESATKKKKLLTPDEAQAEARQKALDAIAAEADRQRIHEAQISKFRAQEAAKSQAAREKAALKQMKMAGKTQMATAAIGQGGQVDVDRLYGAMDEDLSQVPAQPLSPEKGYMQRQGIRVGTPYEQQDIRDYNINMQQRLAKSQELTKKGQQLRLKTEQPSRINGKIIGSPDYYDMVRQMRGAFEKSEPRPEPRLGGGYYSPYGSRSQAGETTEASARRFETGELGVRPAPGRTTEQRTFPAGSFPDVESQVARLGQQQTERAWRNIEEYPGQYVTPPLNEAAMERYRQQLMSEIPGYVSPQQQDIMAGLPKEPQGAAAGLERSQQLALQNARAAIPPDLQYDPLRDQNTALGVGGPSGPGAPAAPGWRNRPVADVQADYDRTSAELAALRAAGNAIPQVAAGVSGMTLGGGQSEEKTKATYLALAQMYAESNPPLSQWYAQQAITSRGGTMPTTTMPPSLQRSPKETADLATAIEKVSLIPEPPNVSTLWTNLGARGTIGIIDDIGKTAASVTSVLLLAGPNNQQAVAQQIARRGWYQELPNAIRGMRNYDLPWLAYLHKNKDETNQIADALQNLYDVVQQAMGGNMSNQQVLPTSLPPSVMQQPTSPRTGGATGSW